MVYFSRNFNLKPVLHNYPDLFEKPRWIGLAKLPTRDYCYVWLLKKYMLFSKTCFTFPKQWQNVLFCSGSSKYLPSSCHYGVKNSANLFKKTEYWGINMHVVKAARVTGIQSECLWGLGATPGAVLYLNNPNHWKRPGSDPTAPCFWRNLTTGLKETFLCKRHNKNYWTFSQSCVETDCRKHI